MGIRQERHPQRETHFTEEARSVFKRAQELARLTSSNIGVYHIFIGTIQEMDPYLREMAFSLKDVTGASVMGKLTNVLTRRYSLIERIGPDQEPAFTVEAKQAIGFSVENARYRGTAEVTPSGIMVGICEYTENFLEKRWLELLANFTRSTKTETGKSKIKDNYEIESKKNLIP